jgi:hypothetical protein
LKLISQRQQSMPSALITLTIMTLTLPLVGCVIPFPSRTCLRDGIAGRVVDARTDRPISGATIKVAYAQSPLYHSTAQQQTVTGRTGDFRVRREYQQHWAYVFGVALNHRWPHPDRFGGPDLPAAVTVEHLDYEPLTYEFRRQQRTTALPDHALSVPLPEPARVYRLTPHTR